jgi:cell shape-determining protein MreD
VVDAERSTWVWSGFSIVLLLFLHFLFRPLFVRLPVAPNLLVGALLLATLRLRAGHAAFLGFGLGLLEAAMALEGMGWYALALTVIGYVGARSRDLLFADARFYVFGYLFVGTWIAESVLLLLGTTPPGLLRLLAGGATDALLTAIVCGGVEAATSSMAERQV